MERQPTRSEARVFVVSLIIFSLTVGGLAAMFAGADESAFARGPLPAVVPLIAVALIAGLILNGLVLNIVARQMGRRWSDFRVSLRATLTPFDPRWYAMIVRSTEWNRVMTSGAIVVSFGWATVMAIVAVGSSPTDPARVGLWTESVGGMVPDGWDTPTELLSPEITDPRDVFAVATFPLRRGEGRCGPFLSRALNDLPNDGAFLTISERSRESAGDGAEFEPLPDRLPPRPASKYRNVDESHECEPEIAFTSWWIPFQEQGRFFYVFVVFGSDASTRTQREAWGIVENLTVDRREF